MIGAGQACSINKKLYILNSQQSVALKVRARSRHYHCPKGQFISALLPRTESIVVVVMLLPPSAFVIPLFPSSAPVAFQESASGFFASTSSCPAAAVEEEQGMYRVAHRFMNFLLLIVYCMFP